MKFLYVDESGNSAQDQYLAFFALQIDAYKLKKAARNVRPYFKAIEEAYPETLRELKTSKMVNGKSGWRRVDADIRKELFLKLCQYPGHIGATAYCYVLDRARYRSKACTPHPCWASSPWLAAATAIALFVQRDNQHVKNNKGLSVLIFDDNRVELPKLSTFLVKSSPDADLFYEKPKKAEPFDHIIDTAFAIQSEHSHLVQVSDACAYALRRKAEITTGGKAPSWDGELALMHKAVRGFARRLKFPSKTWLKNPASDTARWIRDVSLEDFKNWVVA